LSDRMLTLLAAAALCGKSSRQGASNLRFAAQRKKKKDVNLCRLLPGKMWQSPFF